MSQITEEIANIYEIDPILSPKDRFSVVRREERQLIGEIIQDPKRDLDDWPRAAIEWEQRQLQLNNPQPLESKVAEDTTKVLKEETKVSEEEERKKEEEERKKRRRRYAIYAGLLTLFAILVFLAGNFIPPIFPRATSSPPVVTSPPQAVSPEEIIRTIVVTVEVPVTPEPAIETEVPIVPPLETPPPDITEPSPSPLGLTVDDEYKDERVALKFLEYIFEPTYASVGLYRWAIGYKFDFTNNSNEIIYLRYGEGDFHAEDNSGFQYPCEFRRDVSVYPSYEGQLNPRDTHEINVRCGRDEKFGSDVEEITLYVEPFSSLPLTTWLVDVPR